MKPKLNVAIETYNLETETAYPDQDGDFICEGMVCPNQYEDFICEGIHDDCLSCGENIRHPLCPFCIAGGFRQWIAQFPGEEGKILKQLNRFLKIHRRINGKSKTCVACGKNTTHLCPYCFTEYLYKITKEAGLGVRALSEFLFLFNFDFEHNGYSRELEVFGGY